MSRKHSLLATLLLLLTLTACEFSPPVTASPPTTEPAGELTTVPPASDAPSATPTEEDAYPSPPDEVGEDGGDAEDEGGPYPAPDEGGESAPATSPSPTVTEPPPPTHTFTPSPTFTLTPTLTPTFTPTATATPEVAYLYVPQQGTPLTLPNFAHPDAGCDWLGVGGQVFDSESVAVQNLVVIVYGVLGDSPVDMLTMTGQAEDYGPGGYEFVLADTPVTSEGSLWVQVKNLNGEPLSGRIYLDTHAECAENLVLLNFVEAGE